MMKHHNFKTAAILIFCSFLTLSLNAQIEGFKHKSEPQGISYAEQAPHTFILKDTFNASISKVWGIIGQYDMWLKWFPRLDACNNPDGKPIGLNAKRFAQVGKMKFYEEIILFEKEKAFGFTVLSSNKKIPKSLVELLYVEAIDQNTTILTYKGGVKWGGLACLFPKLANKRLLNSWKDSFRNIKILASQN